jgi:asparagine synthase (glutamine-hydrolysing)
MSGLAGIVSRERKLLGSDLRAMLNIMRHRGPDGAGIAIGDRVQQGSSVGELQFEGLEGNVAIGQIQLRSDDGSSRYQPFQSADGSLRLFYVGEIYNGNEIGSELRGPHRNSGNGGYIALRYLEENYRGNLKRTVEELVARLDGVYVLAAADGIQTVLARDRIGIRQLYYAELKDRFAFATEKKSLLELSGADTEIRRLPPGHLAAMNGAALELKAFWDPHSLLEDERITDARIAVDAYGKTVCEAVRKRLAGKDRVGIIFSGGIDSLLVTHLIQQSGVPFTCYTAGREGSEDLAWARSIAEKAGYPILMKTISLAEIEQLLTEIISTIEDHSYNQIEAATAMFFANRLAQEAGEHTVFTGQAADEIFGGYPWYPVVVEREGFEQFERYAWDDFIVGYKETFERENKIAATHGLGMSVPYADPDVDRVAFNVSPELKIWSGADDIQKRFHREFAVSAGIPAEVAFRKKAAAQHGANIHGAYEKLAEKAGIAAPALEQAGYDPDMTVVEKLGSSSRYGYRYGSEHLWKPSPCVQFYLDLLATRLKMLPSRAESHVREVAGKTGHVGMIS